MLTATKLFSRLTVLALLGAMVAVATPVFQANAMEKPVVSAPESSDYVRHKER